MLTVVIATREPQLLKGRADGGTLGNSLARTDAMSTA
jgi:hypothetical protein